MNRVFVGYDSREVDAYTVCRASLLRRTKEPVDIVPLMSDRLQLAGLLSRPMDYRGSSPYDFISQAPASTEFAASRFLVPILAQSGFALFVDCDMVFLDDVSKLFALADATKAVQVVKNAHQQGDVLWKMDGKAQTYYARKNWSSVILWNCDHPANRRLNLHCVNNWPGRMLHQFGWLHEEEIGELPGGWNWLVNVNKRPDPIHLAHFTLGGPWINGWQESPNDNIWLEEARSL